MSLLTSIFQRRRVLPERLAAYGFAPEGAGWLYRTTLASSGFILTVSVGEAGEVAAAVVDPATGEPYTLHEQAGAVGSFVGAVRSEYEEALRALAERCSEPDVFKSAQARQLIAWVRERYGGELEFLWAKFPDNAIWRRADTGKWYGALLTVNASKLGLAGAGTVEILDLRARPQELPELLTRPGYLPGYHMNKQHWYTALLNGTLPIEELCRGMEQSYGLAVK